MRVRVGESERVPASDTRATMMGERHRMRRRRGNAIHVSDCVCGESAAPQSPSRDDGSTERLGECEGASITDSRLRLGVARRARCVMQSIL